MGSNFITAHGCRITFLYYSSANSFAKIEVILMSIKPFISYATIVMFASWILGFCGFAVYAYMLKFSTIPSADAIVVLTGGAERLSTALNLLEKQKAPQMLISGVNSKVSMGALFKKIDEKHLNQITLGYKADNTFENALETKEWTTKKNIKSILLVTSFYHMPRSLFEIRSAIQDLTIYPVSVFMHTEQHWTYTRSAWLLFVEYNKFIVRFVQLLIRRAFL
ncbi:MAG: YdcF family protein [Alphaproteobacteria bacterium]|nr:YdcF family protein [Alphaproteobacteria bacterium]